VAEADGAVSALSRAQAVGMIRQAVRLVGDWSTAEDVVQEAFGGLYRRWAVPHARADRGYPGCIV